MNTPSWAKKAYNPEVVDNGSVTAPKQAASNDEEPFVFELAELALGAPSTSYPESPPYEARWPALIEKMERLTDVVSGMEAKITMVARLTGMVSQMEATMLQRFHTIEDKLTQLQQDRIGAVQPAFQAAFQGADNWDWHWPKP